MANRLSRRQILGIGAGSLAAGAAWTDAGPARSHDQPPRGRAKAMGDRAYWSKSYSGGPIDVAPQPPGLPGDHYKPVVVPNGAALPLRRALAGEPMTALRGAIRGGARAECARCVCSMWRDPGEFGGADFPRSAHAGV